jgi:hypothetical protein
MKVKIPVLLTALLFTVACGTSISSLDEIENRLKRSKCRLNRENLVFAIEGLEYKMDTVFTDIPENLLNDSLQACPASGELYVMLVEGDNRRILCPVCQNESSF